MEDKLFIDIMDGEFGKDSDGKWCAPLPFRPTRPRLPNNRMLALRRAKMLHRNLLNDSEKRQHFTDFMEKLLANNHAEIAPPLKDNDECWYLPVFGVYHPKKPGQIRCVFDSSATYADLSLNKVLLQGPDLNNSLLGVLMRFRKNLVGASADIKQMFYSFNVREDHRNFLRFIWHKDNDLDKELIDYRMRVHVFGNSPSPAVAIYGLHKTGQLADSDVQNFVQRNFYVDDGLISLENSTDTVDLLTRTQKAFIRGRKTMVT